MAAINFPSSPANGDTHVVDGVTYTYNSAETKWKTTINSNAFLPLSGGTLSGNVGINVTNPSENLQVDNTLLLGSSNASGSSIKFTRSGQTSAGQVTSDGSSNLLIETAGSERVRIASNGAIGIAGANFGSSGQVLTSGGASAAPSWADAAATSVAVIVDQKTQNTPGGTFTASAWRTRDLNTEVSDPDGIVSISSNQFTLGAGTYLIYWECPAYRVGRHITRLYDVTGTAVVELGMTKYDESTAQTNGISPGSAVVSPTANNTYEIQHQSAVSKVTNGFGVESNLTGAGERYTRVIIWKVA